MNNSYTLKELSKDLDIDVKVLREYIKKGHLRASKVGRTYLVSSVDLKAFLDTDIAFSKRGPEPDEIPMRNYICQHYDYCLDKAAKANKIFGCENCRRFIRAKKQQLSIAELNGMISLWGSVFGSTASVS
ncbi:helix-turn-helix domain-containing protein [Desulfonema magnum]|uniref:HTH domain-containing protein n=1 Tax=Desulfonema magnum TaxID=45655 RepID=A0A975BPS2_9BACT|nr:helix-turn-helix domain-containing protein [Desulfonema magnum]QTA89446.1 HTH domain-containing protein [Desulfonema magnum]